MRTPKPGAGGEQAGTQVVPPPWTLPVPLLMPPPPTSCGCWLSLGHCPGGWGGWGRSTVGVLCPAYPLPCPVNGALVNSCLKHGGNPVSHVATGRVG